MQSLKWITAFGLVVSFNLQGICQPADSLTADKVPAPSILDIYGRYLQPQNEILSQRSLTSRHYRIDGKTNIALVYSNPVFYKVGRGSLKPISDMIIPTDEKKDEGYSLRNEANDVLFYFSDDASRCMIEDAEGRELAIVSSAYAASAGSVSISGNHLAKTLEQDSAEFIWTVQGSGISYRAFINRRLKTEELKALVNIDWRQPTSTEDHSEDRASNAHMTVSTVAPDGRPDRRLEIAEMITLTDTTTILLGSISRYPSNTGTIYKSSPAASPISAGSGLRIQNLSDPGCTYGYRCWVRYNLSGLPANLNVTAVEQHLYVAALHEHLFDLVDMDVTHLVWDPTAFSLQSTWDAIYSGKRYLSDLGILGVQWCNLELPLAAGDLSHAISSPGWFGLGFMVWCNEDNSDFYVNFGSSPYLVIVYSPSTGVAENGNLPSHYALLQNYPNPFNPVTKIEYRVPTASHILLRVSDVLGREIALLVNEVKSPGEYGVTWDASSAPGGTYFCRIQAASVNDPGKTFTQVRKMLLVK